MFLVGCELHGCRYLSMFMELPTARQAENSEK